MTDFLTEAALHLGRARLLAPKADPGVRSASSRIDEQGAAIRELADCLEWIIKHLTSEIGTPRPAAELQTFGDKLYKPPVEYTLCNCKKHSFPHYHYPPNS